MPTGNYSYSSSGDQRPFAITEPGDYGRSAGVQAKEPDRQTTSRRSTQSNRNRSAMATEDESTSQPRARSAQKSSARRGAAQPRRASERAGAASARRGATSTETKSRGKKSRRGFAAMSPEQQREIARKGGLTVSRNRRHMADIGRVGGEHSHGGRRARR